MKSTGKTPKKDKRLIVGHLAAIIPDYAIENLLRAEIAANTDISSYFLFTVGVATFSKKILAGISVFIALLTLVTIPIA
jgi:hypothetical protein